MTEPLAEALADVPRVQLRADLSAPVLGRSGRGGGRRCCGPWWSTSRTAPTCSRRSVSPGVDSGTEEAVRAAVTYVAGMTDRFACRTAMAQLGWDKSRLPRSAVSL